MPTHRTATGLPVEVRADIMRLSKAALAEILWDVLTECEGGQKTHLELVGEIYRRDTLLVQVR